MLYRQFTLERTHAITGTRMAVVCWLPEKHGAHVVEVGTQLTLESFPDLVWTVVQRGEDTRTLEEVVEIRRKHRNFSASLPEKCRIA